MTTTIAAKNPAKLNPAKSAAARRATRAEVLEALRGEFRGAAAEKHKALGEMLASFGELFAIAPAQAIESYGGWLARDEEISKVWATFEVAYLPDSTTGLTWLKLADLADQLTVRLLSDAASPSGCSDQVRAAIETYRIAGRAIALREVRELAARALDRLAAAAPNPTA